MNEGFFPPNDGDDRVFIGNFTIPTLKDYWLYLIMTELLL